MPSRPKNRGHPVVQARGQAKTRPTGAAGVLLGNFLRDNNAFSFVPYSISPSPSFLLCSGFITIWRCRSTSPPPAKKATSKLGDVGGRRGRTDRGAADNDCDLIQSEFEFDYFIMTKTAGDGITELYKCREYAAAATLE